jgi:hypothetical protein
MPSADGNRDNTRVSQQGGRYFVDEHLSNKLQAFFLFTNSYRTCGRGGVLSTPYRINLPARDITFDRGSVQSTYLSVGNHGCFNTQPFVLVAGRWLLALLASGLGSSVGAPSRNLEISKSRNLPPPSSSYPERMREIGSTPKAEGGLAIAHAAGGS